nr:beta-catenin-like protein 1 [Cryptococcus depauperatus CBS 7841]
MFKIPAVPTGGKRKMPNLPGPEVLKKYKAENPEKEKIIVSEKGKERAATVEDEDLKVDYSTGKSIYVNLIKLMVYDGGNDEEGRFFGGGLNVEQEQILDIFDKAGPEEGSSALDLPSLRRQLAKFERTVTKNAEQRGKWPDDPSRFIDSESDLDASIKLLLPLTQNPPLFYPELIKAGTLPLLTNLLSHENTDIAMDVVEVIQELTDEDVGAEVDDLEGGEGNEERASKTRIAIGELIDELLNNSLFELLVSNLGRLDEKEDADSQGVFHVLGVFENLLSFMPPLADQIVETTTLLTWLLKRIQVEEYNSNKQYASEILAILLQESREIVMRVNQEGLDIMLQVLSQYLKKDPTDSEEIEFMENIFGCICSCLAQPEMKTAFLEAEGVELMVMMMKEKKLAKTRAIKVLDYALQSEDGCASCIRFVEALGLKTLFSAFMGKGNSKSKHNATSTIEDEEHMLGILASLFTNLESDTAPRIRLIAKFVESGYEKVERLLELREGAEGRLGPVIKEISHERQVMEANKEEVTEQEETEWYLRKIDAGLATLQSADYVLAWVCMEDDGAMTHARLLLSRKGLSFNHVIGVLQELRDNVGDGDESEGDTTAASVQKMILGELITFLKEL